MFYLPRFLHFELSEGPFEYVLSCPHGGEAMPVLRGRLVGWWVAPAIFKLGSRRHVASGRLSQLLFWPAVNERFISSAACSSCALRKLSSPLGWRGLSCSLENTEIVRKRTGWLRGCHSTLTLNASVLSESFFFHIFVEISFIYFLLIWDSLYSM